MSAQAPKRVTRTPRGLGEGPVFATLGIGGVQLSQDSVLVHDPPVCAGSPTV